MDYSKPSNKIKIAWFSSQDTNSASGNFSNSVLNYLKEKNDLKIIEFGGDANHFLNFKKLDKKIPFDLAIYNLDNHPKSQIYRQIMGARPGISIFHDFYFYDMGPESNLQSPWEKVLKKFAEDMCEGRDSKWDLKLKEFTHYGPWGYREAAMSLIPCFTKKQGLEQFKAAKEDKVLNWDYNLNLTDPKLLKYPSKNITHTKSKNIRIGTIDDLLLKEDLYDLVDTAKIFPNAELKCLTEHKNAMEIADILGYKEDISYTYLDKDKTSLNEFISGIDILFLNSDQKPISFEPYLSTAKASGVQLIASNTIAEESKEGVYIFNPGLKTKQDLKKIFKQILESPNIKQSPAIDAKDSAQQLYEIISQSLEITQKFYQHWRNFEKSAFKNVKETNINALNDPLFTETPPLKDAIDFIKEL